MTLQLPARVENGRIILKKDLPAELSGLEAIVILKDPPENLIAGYCSSAASAWDAAQIQSALADDEDWGQELESLKWRPSDNA